MEEAQTPPPRTDGELDKNQNGDVSADNDSRSKTIKHHPGSIYEVSNEKPINEQGIPITGENMPSIKEPSCVYTIPKIVVHTPEGNVETVEDNDLSSGVMHNIPAVTVCEVDKTVNVVCETTDDSDEQSKTSSHYLTPPSSCDSTPAARYPNTLAVSPDSDSSVTNDEDIQVICRYSSTPVNSCIGKTLNDTDCSMSTVDDASPISQAEISKANVSSNRSAVAADENIEKPKANPKEPVEQDVMYVQQQAYSVKPNQDVGQENVDIKSPFRMYGREQEYPMHYQHDYTNHSVGMYQGGIPNEYNPPYMHSQSGFTEYYPNGQRSWTDMRGRFERPYVSYPLQTDPCCYPNADGGGSERMCFVYPSIYVSNAGLISVLLRNDMSVEMTVDRTIRVVSHNHMMAVATDSKGTSACLYHPAVKVFQMGYGTDISTDSFRARMDNGDAILFSNGVNFFRLQDSELQPIAPLKFSDINRDQSVNLLFSSEGYGESLVATCMQVAAQAEYANLPKGGVIVRINGVKVTQSGCGDVTVVTGAKFIRLSPHNGTTRLGNRFLDIEVERDWSIKLTRGSHSFVSTKRQVTVCNGKMEAGFDENNVLKVVNLQARYPLLTEPSIVRRPGRKIVRGVQSTQSACSTPRRRFPIQGASRGGTNSC